MATNVGVYPNRDAFQPFSRPAFPIRVCRLLRRLPRSPLRAAGNAGEGDTGAQHYAALFGITSCSNNPGAEMQSKWSRRAVWLAVILVLLLWPVAAR